MCIWEVFYLGIDFKKTLKGVLLSLAISILLTVLLAVVVFFADLSDRTVSTLILLASALSVFLGAIILSKNIESRGLLNGLLLAILYFLVLFAVSSLSGAVAIDRSNLLRFISVLAAGMLGGILGINSKKA